MYTLETSKELFNVLPSKKGVQRSKEANIQAMPITTPTKQLLVKLNRDELSDIILNDPVIIRCAEKLATKAPNVATASRNTLRELARLVQMMRQLLNTNDFGPLSVIDPTLGPKTVQCIQQLLENSPSYGQRIDHTL